MKKQFLLMLLVLSMVALSLTACGGGEETTTTAPADDTTTTTAATDDADDETGNGDESDNGDDLEEITLRVAWWGGQERADVTTEVLDMYSDLYPHVNFETEFSAWGDYWDKMATYSAASSLPDILQHDYSRIYQYVENDLLADLYPFVDSGDLDLSDVDENVVTSGAFDGKLYGISLGTNTIGMLLDPAIIEEAGLDRPDDQNWTWADYEEMAQVIFETTGKKADIPFVDDPKFMIEYNARSAGYPLYTEDGSSLGFDDPSFISDFFEMELRMIEAGITTSPEELLVDKPLEEADIVLGNSFGGPVWSNFAVMYIEAAGRPLELFLMPKYEGGSDPGLYLKPSQFFSVAENSEYKNVAANVISFWTNDIDVNKVLMADRGVPVAGAVREAMTELVSDSVAVTFDYIDYAAAFAGEIDPPEPAATGEITNLIKEINEEILFGRTTPEDAAQRIIERANDILSR